MPIAEAGFLLPTGAAIPSALLQLGPTIQVVVSRLIAPPAPGALAGIPPVVAPPVQPAAAPMAQVVAGLVDTGAAQSCIDSDLAAQLQLPVVDRVSLAGSNGAHQHDVFAAQISVPALGITETGRFAGVHLAGGQQPHHVLLGRTFLQNVVMIYDGRRAQVMLASASIFGGFPGFGAMMPAAPIIPPAPAGGPLAGLPAAVAPGQPPDVAAGNGGI